MDSRIMPRRNAVCDFSIGSNWYDWFLFGDSLFHETLDQNKSNDRVLISGARCNLLLWILKKTKQRIDEEKPIVSVWPLWKILVNLYVRNSLAAFQKLVVSYASIKFAQTAYRTISTFDANIFQWTFTYSLIVHLILLHLVYGSFFLSWCSTQHSLPAKLNNNTIFLNK